MHATQTCAGGQVLHSNLVPVSIHPSPCLYGLFEYIQRQYGCMLHVSKTVKLNSHPNACPKALKHLSDLEYKPNKNVGPPLAESFAHARRAHPDPCRLGPYLPTQGSMELVESYDDLSMVLTTPKKPSVSRSPRGLPFEVLLKEAHSCTYQRPTRTRGFSAPGSVVAFGHGGALHSQGAIVKMT